MPEKINLYDGERFSSWFQKFLSVVVWFHLESPMSAGHQSEVHAVGQIKGSPLTSLK